MAFNEFTTTMGTQQGIDEMNGRFDANVGHEHDGGAYNGKKVKLGSLDPVGRLIEAIGGNIASASTLDLTVATGNLVHITGTTTITAVTLTNGPIEVIFDGTLILTHHATNNNLPGAVDITTMAGDRATYWSDGTTVYCIKYQRANGDPIKSKPAMPSVNAGIGQWVLISSAEGVDMVLPAGGTWAHHVVRYTSTGVNYNEYDSVHAGGTTLFFGAIGYTGKGFAWRIA